MVALKQSHVTCSVYDADLVYTFYGFVYTFLHYSSSWEYWIPGIVCYARRDDFVTRRRAQSVRNCVEVIAAMQHALEHYRDFRLF